LHATLFELLFEHLVELAANPLGINALLSIFLVLMSSMVCSKIFAGLKLGGKERGGNSLKVSTN
jgi:hypothetical protein